MTDEEEAFGKIKERVVKSQSLELLGANPPSGKSYYGDLITFRSPTRKGKKTKRNHVDLIFCSLDDIYICEIKGNSSNSKQDIKKLDRILQNYGIEGIKNAIAKRLSWESRNLHETSNVVKSIGCKTLDEVRRSRDFLFIEANKNNVHVTGNKSQVLKRLI